MPLWPAINLFAAFRRRNRPRLARLIVTPDHRWKGFPQMSNRFKASVPDGVAKHFTFTGLDQYDRPIALSLPLSLVGQDGQIAVDGNGLGFSATLTPGGMSAFTVTDGNVTTAVEIDSPLAVLATIVVSADP